MFLADVLMFIILQVAHYTCQLLWSHREQSHRGVLFPKKNSSARPTAKNHGKNPEKPPPSNRFEDFRAEFCRILEFVPAQEDGLPPLIDDHFRPRVLRIDHLPPIDDIHVHTKLHMYYLMNKCMMLSERPGKTYHCKLCHFQNYLYYPTVGGGDYTGRRRIAATRQRTVYHLMGKWVLLFRRLLMMRHPSRLT